MREGEGYGMPSLRESCVERWQVALRNNREAVMQSAPLQVSGRLTKVTGLVMEAVGLRMAVGSTCWIELPQNRIEDRKSTRLNSSHT